MTKRSIPRAYKQVVQKGVWVALIDGPRHPGSPFERSDVLWGQRHLKLDGWPDSLLYELDHIGAAGVHYYRFKGTKDGTGLAR